MKAPSVPDRPTLDGIEERWSARWEEDGIYRLDGLPGREDVHAIDTPPPTVSGELHVGHVFSFTHTDVVARFWRMRGKAVFYPIGWDDNGLATERRVQNYFGVLCDPSLSYDPHFVPPSPRPDPPVAVSRPNFVELCARLTAEDEKAFEELFRRLGTSFDWGQHYRTIGERARRVSQVAFLRMLRRDEAYRQEAPTLWDVDFRTAVAQAELVDREVPGAYHRLRFRLVADDREAGEQQAVEVDTTRPELVPACVALVTHPSDERYSGLVGKVASTPLFSVPVPIVAHRLADPTKGTGIAMICTFGDLTDVLWWRELSLPTRTVVQRDGTFADAPFGDAGWESDDPDRARRLFRQLVGLDVSSARERIGELLRETGDLVGEPRPVTHAVKFYERGERPLEIVSSPQWFVRTVRMHDRLIERGRELAWHPPFMRSRYESWVNGLTGDWNISRQRFFGVPFPVWYRLDDNGEPVADELLLPAEERLPVDPSTDVPEGYGEDERGKPGGFVGDPDVMDTWATSSLTPQIAGGWPDEPAKFARVYPMDVRPQAHEIIRTWLFATIVRSELEHGQLPWRHAAISGWILDPDHRKLSKSLGNASTPLEYLERYSTDAVRYWAGSARLGSDTVFSEEQMKVGRKLAIKVLNASRFVLSRLDDVHSAATATELVALDASMLAGLGAVVDEATTALESYEHARALEVTESFFRGYCDDYLELVKSRAYRDAAEEGSASARAALGASLSVLLRLIAPFLPYCTEEAWSWWQDGSIHTSKWPEAGELFERAGPGARPEVMAAASEVLVAVRRAKTAAHRSMRARVARCDVKGPSPLVELVERAVPDLVQAGAIDRLELTVEAETDSLSVTVELADDD
jgi:valyl-tRNA synthetase